jgi:hypothetical protein
MSQKAEEAERKGIDSEELHACMKEHPDGRDQVLQVGTEDELPVSDAPGEHIAGGVQVVHVVVRPRNGQRPQIDKDAAGSDGGREEEEKTGSNT